MQLEEETKESPPGQAGFDAVRAVSRFTHEAPEAEEEPSPPKIEAEPEKTPKKFAVASEKGVGAGVALFLQKEQPEFVNGVRVRKKKDESEKDK